MTDEADEAPRDTHLPSPMEAKEFPGQVRFLALLHVLNKKAEIQVKADLQTQLFCYSKLFAPILDIRSQVND